MKPARPTGNRKASSDDDKPYISPKARQRPVRVIPPDDEAEMRAGHLIPAGGVPRQSDDDAPVGKEGGYGDPNPNDDLGGGGNDDTDDLTTDTSSRSLFDED